DRAHRCALGNAHQCGDRCDSRRRARRGARRGAGTVSVARTNNTSSAARASRWSKHLQRCAQRAARVPPPPVEGVLTRMIGLTLEAAGCQAAIGDRCEVLAADCGRVEAEVVGFAADRLYLTPTGDIHGLKPNARVVPRLGAEMVSVGPQLLGRIIDGAGTPLDGLGPI